MEAPDIKYYQVVIDTQTQSHILKSELQDLVNEIKKYVAWTEGRLNKEVADICSCDDPWPFALSEQGLVCKKCGKFLPEQD